MAEHTSLHVIGAPTRENAEGFVRLIVEAFRDAANGNPSVEIAVEEIMMTFEDALQDQERLNALEAEALVRCVGIQSDGVDPTSILATRDGYKVTWSPTAQGLPINMLYRRTVREAIDVIRVAAQEKDQTLFPARSGLAHKSGDSNA